MHPVDSDANDAGQKVHAQFGSFHATDLELILRSRGTDTIILGGIDTNVCVDTTAHQAAVRGPCVLSLTDGTANFDLSDGDSALQAPKNASAPSRSWPSDSPRSSASTTR